MKQSSLKDLLEGGPPCHSEWNLVFEDTFQADQVDWEVWNSQAGASRGRLSSRWPENCIIEDGILRLMTHRGPHPDAPENPWTSASMWTRHQRFSYGYFECRLRYAPAQGLNNAFWIYRDSDQGPNDSLEIDFNEGHYPGEIAMALHWYDPDNREHRMTRSQAIDVPEANLAESFHVYGCEWNERFILYYFDGCVIRRLPHNVARGANMRLWLSTMVYPNWTPQLDGKSMDVDWIRAYTLTGPAKTHVSFGNTEHPQIEATGARSPVIEQDFHSIPEGAVPHAMGEILGKPAIVQSPPSRICTAVVPSEDGSRIQPAEPAQAKTDRHPKALRLMAPPHRAADTIHFDFPVQTGRIEVAFDLLITSPWTRMAIGLTNSFQTRPDYTRVEDPWAEHCGPYLLLEPSGYIEALEERRWIWETKARALGMLPAGLWNLVRLVIDLQKHVFDLHINNAYKDSAQFAQYQDALKGILFHKKTDPFEPQQALIDHIRISALKPE